MSDCFAASYHAPASSMQILAPAFASTCAATPPPAPDPTITTSYVAEGVITLAMSKKLRVRSKKSIRPGVRANYPKLCQQAKLIDTVPRFDDFSIRNSGNGNSGELNLAPGGISPKAL